MRKPEPMNPWQVAVAKKYGQGDYAHLIDDPNWRDALPDCGDTLFRFLMIELSTAEGCEDPETAEQRILGAMTDIETAYRAVCSM